MPDLPMIAPGYGDDEPVCEDLTHSLQNTCVIDKSVLTEAMGAATSQPLLRVLRIVEPALIALCLGMLIWTVATKKGTGPAVLIGFVLVSITFLFLWQFLIYPRRTVKQLHLRQALEDGTLALTNRLWFTDENVANRRGDSERVLHMGYDRIKRVSETGRLIVITTRTNHLVPLDKAGFENGGAEDFYRLIERKAPNARIENKKGR